MNKQLKNIARETAIKEVKLRTVTKDQAKEDFIKWIDDTLSKNSFLGDNILSFWEEVKNQAKAL